MRVKISVDQNNYEVERGDNLLHACLSAGLDIPYFCWHPALGSVGSCRQCAVKMYRDGDDHQGRLVMACMEACAEGTRISIDDPEAVEFRAQVIEWLMVNHPHDCPVCDEGGECHLQDMTVQTGHDYRRYRFQKRTHQNQYLGPFIDHEMNRCIACYRCVRYYRDYAGGEDLNAFGAHDNVYFGRQEDGVLENDFAGNLVEICPTGVFTDKTFKQHYTRKWDLQTAPSVCNHCGLGCNVIPGERYGELRRILNRYHQEINGYFLCDRGRFGYDFVNSDQRVREPLIRDPGTGELGEASLGVAIKCVASAIKKGNRVLGIGSPRASVEGNFVLRELVGADNFFAGVSQSDFALVATTLEIMQGGAARSPSLKEVGSADAVLLLGEDPSDTAPMLALTLRQSVRQQPIREAVAAGIPQWHDLAVRNLLQEQRGPLFIATPGTTRLDDIATETYRAAPDDIARLGCAVAHELDQNAPAVPGLAEEIAALAQRIAEALKKAEQPMVVSGTGAGSEAVLHAAADVAAALRVAREQRVSPEHSGLFLTVPECNSLGLQLLGGEPLQRAFDLVESGAADTVIIVENDLYRRADRIDVDSFLDAVQQRLTVVDHLMHATAQRAQNVLPAATFAETDGTLVNNEGRAQKFYQVFKAKGDIEESWRWLRDSGDAAGREGLDFVSLAGVHRALAAAYPVFDLDRKKSSATLRYAEDRVPRGSHRYSGRTAMNAHIDVHEQKPPEPVDSALAFSMEGHQDFGGSLITSYWAPSWNSVQALNKFQFEVGGALRGGDPGRLLIRPDSITAERARREYSKAPAAYRRKKDQWLMVPGHHIFGSDELSLHSAALLERVPKPYIALNSGDAEDLGVAIGDEVEIVVAGGTVRLPVKLSAELPSGVATVPVGLPGLGFVDLTAMAGIVRVAE